MMVLRLPWPMPLRPFVFILPIEELVAVQSALGKAQETLSQAIAENDLSNKMELGQAKR